MGAAAVVAGADASACASLRPITGFSVPAAAS